MNNSRPLYNNMSSFEGDLHLKSTLPREFCHSQFGEQLSISNLPLTQVHRKRDSGLCESRERRSKGDSELQEVHLRVESPSCEKQSHAQS